MKKDIVQRQCGDKTRNAIIKAALKLFTQSGFSGTSLTDIASEAKVNKSLILHHFVTKESLWKIVKYSFMSQIAEEDLVPEVNNVEDFMRLVVEARFNLYDKNPEFARIVSWQRLEKDQTRLEGLNKIGFKDFVDKIKYFQQNKQIRQDLDPDLFTMFILVSISGAFLIRENPFETERDKMAYKNMVLENILNTMSPKKWKLKK